MDSNCRREHSDDGRTWWGDRSGDMVRSGEQFEQFGKMLCAQSQAYLANLPERWNLYRGMTVKGMSRRVCRFCHGGEDGFPRWQLAAVELCATCT